MLRARVDLNQILPDQPLDKEQMREALPALRSNLLFQYLLRRLQRRLLDLQADRSNNHESLTADRALFAAGAAYGAARMLDAVDGVLSDSVRGTESEGQNG